MERHCRLCSGRVVRMVVLAALAAAATGDARADDPAAADPNAQIDVEAELLAKSATPTPEQISRYGEALGLYKYRVLRVTRGELAEQVIGVMQWVIWRSLPQPPTRVQVGKKLHLALVPLAKVAPAVQTVFRSETIDAPDLPLYYDARPALELPPEDRTRWGYADISPMVPVLFALKDQLRCVILGDCQAWFANMTELYYAPTNSRTPVALSMAQPRSGLPFQKLMAENYLVHLPKLEWVIVTWHTRWVNAGWTEHGIKGRAFEQSPGVKYDREHPAEVWKPSGRKPWTVAEIEADPRLGPAWRNRPWGYLNPAWVAYARKDEPTSRPTSRPAGFPRSSGRYTFVPERWAMWEAMVKSLVERKIRVLAYTQPVHPSTATAVVKDKSGTDEAGYLDQVRRMGELEKRHAGYFFFYDLNNMGDNGLETGDFVNIDHPSRRGARKVIQRVEAWRLRLIREHNLRPRSP